MEYYTQQFTQHVQKYIEQGHTDLALELLGKCLPKDNHFFAEILTLQNQYNELKRRENLGLDSDKMRMREISFVTVEYLRRIEKHYSPKIDLVSLPSNYTNVIQNKDEIPSDSNLKQKPNYNLFKIIIGLFILSIAYCLFSKIEELNSIDRGVGLFNAKDYAGSFKILSENKLIIKQSKSALASLYLGNLYYLGYGTEKNDEEALIWWRNSADYGSLDAMLWIGEMYYYGGRGVVSDKSKANEYYNRAAVAYEDFGKGDENDIENKIDLFQIKKDRFEKYLIEHFIRDEDCKNAGKWIKISWDKKYIKEGDEIVKKFVQKCLHNTADTTNIFMNNSNISKPVLWSIIAIFIIICGIITLLITKRISQKKS